MHHRFRQDATSHKTPIRKHRVTDGRQWQQRMTNLRSVYNLSKLKLFCCLNQLPFHMAALSGRNANVREAVLLAIVFDIFLHQFFSARRNASRFLGTVSVASVALGFMGEQVPVGQEQLFINGEGS